MASKASPPAKQTPSVAVKENTSGRMNLSTTGSVVLPSSTAYEPTSNSIPSQPGWPPNRKHGPGLAPLVSSPTPHPHTLTDAFAPQPAWAVLPSPVSLSTVNFLFPCATLSAHFGGEPKRRAEARPLHWGETHADPRRRLETALRVHRFGELAQAHAGGGSVRACL